MTPTDLIPIGSTARETLAVIENIAGMTWRRYRGQQATARRWAHDPEGWGELNRQVMVRTRSELKTMLRQRRDVRRQVEVIEDRVDDGAKR